MNRFAPFVLLVVTTLLLAQDKSSSAKSAFEGPILDAANYGRKLAAGASARMRDAEILKEPPSGADPGAVVKMTHWDKGLRELPVAQSAMVVLATVTAAEARLIESGDRAEIVSDFGLLVQKVFKGEVEVGATLTAMRSGGAIRYASGRMREFRVHGQGFPQVGGRYVFFLRTWPHTGEYVITTAYALQNGVVQPLDGERAGSARMVFDRLKSSSEQAFLDALRDALAHDK